jgi:hypothetical protein
MCVCRGIGWQADPQLEVAADGTVYGVILQGSGGHGWVEVEVKSTDHGATWGPPVNTTPDLRKTIDQRSADHGFLTISPDGKDQYVAFEGRRNWVVASHDHGATWETPVETSLPSDPFRRWYFNYKGAVTAGGIVNIAVASVSAKPYARHRVVYMDLRSADKGATWTRTRIASYEEQPACLSKGCDDGHLGANTNLAADAGGDLVQVFAGSKVKAKGQAIYASASSDGGLTWSAPKLMSPKTADGRRVVASFPAIAGGVAGDFRMWWMDDRKGITAWNVWYTETDDGGATWSKEVRISDAISGASYVTARGFLADYGDYGGIDILSDGGTIATWGEGVSYDGPGGTWINRLPAP